MTYNPPRFTAYHGERDLPERPAQRLASLQSEAVECLPFVWVAVCPKVGEAYEFCLGTEYSTLPSNDQTATWADDGAIVLALRPVTAKASLERYRAITGTNDS
jgi:hypothetical protein